MTPASLIRLILRDAGVNGVGQAPKAEDNNDVLATLNMMLDEWSSQRWLVYHLVDVVASCNGNTAYTVGTGGDFNVTRPDRIEAAFFRSTSSGQYPVDYPLREISAREDYNDIAQKTVGNWPSWFFYDSDYPLGSFYPWPVPTSGIGSLHLTLKCVLNEFSDLTTTINLPPAYINAIRWNGAVRAAPMYGMEASETVKGLARSALAVVRGSNTQLPVLHMPQGVSVRGGRYNIYSDQGR